MKSIKEILLDLESYYRNLLKVLEEADREMIEGRVDVFMNKGVVQYYHVRVNPESQEEEKIYIKKEDHDLAKSLAQQQYDRRVELLMRKRLCQLQAILQDFEDDEIDTVYNGYSELRQALIEPIQPTAQMLPQEWKTRPYQTKGFAEGELIILTKKGSGFDLKQKRSWPMALLIVRLNTSTNAHFA